MAIKRVSYRPSCKHPQRAVMPDICSGTGQVERVERYGLSFPGGTSDVSIELYAYRHYSETDKTRARWEHFYSAITGIWPEQYPDGTPGFIPSEWTIRRIRGWCEPTFTPGDENFCTWWGPSSTGKSTDAAVIVLADWLAAPDKTTTNVCSTTKPMLERRIWNEILKFYFRLPEKVGEYYAGRMAICFNPKDPRDGIFGNALQRGTVQDTSNSMIGVHNDYNRLILDELQTLRWGCIEAWDNLSASGRGGENKLLGMGNPFSKLDTLGRVSRPNLPGGWDAISPATEAWPTKAGKTLFFNGMRSPGVVNPDRFPHLLNAEAIARMRIDPGENSPRFWSQRIGFIPPDGMVQTVLAESMISASKMDCDPDWQEKSFIIAAIDPAYRATGNRCVICFLRIGQSKDGGTIIAREEIRRIAITPNEFNPSEPRDFTTARRLWEACKEKGVLPKHIGMDISGTQSAFQSIFESICGEKIYGINFSNRASKFRASPQDGRPGEEVYRDRVTEIWHLIRWYALSGMLRGFSNDEENLQITSRRVLEDKGRMYLEAKRDMEGMGDDSPDEGDTIAMALCVAREQVKIKFGEKDKDRSTAAPKKRPIDDEAEDYLSSVTSSEDEYAPHF